MDDTEIVRRFSKGPGSMKKARAAPGSIRSGPRAPHQRGQQEMLVILFSAYVFPMPEPFWALSPPQ